MASGKGFGKVILFGEHFVVHRLPGIVSAIDSTAEVVVEKIPGDQYQLIDKTIKFPGVEDFSWKVCKNTILRVLKFLKISQKIKITLQGELMIPNSGLGSSAAHMVGLARALSKEFNLNLNDEQINRAAFEGEKEIHGNPSGIDNTAATYGGTFWFEKRNLLEKNLIKKIDLKKPIEIVLVESGKKTSTKDAVFKVKKFVEENKEKSKKIFDDYKKLVNQAKTILKTNLNEEDLKNLGHLMNKNHELLQELKISCPELDEIVEISKNAGALGAKLTGTGMGGLAIALTPRKDLQENVAKKIEEAGYAVFKTTI